MRGVSQGQNLGDSCREGELRRGRGMADQLRQALSRETGTGFRHEVGGGGGGGTTAKAARKTRAVESVRLPRGVCWEVGVPDSEL